MIKVTIVVVSFNTRELLDRCIASVLEASPNVEKELIVVENASCDGSREMLAEKYPMVRIIANDNNRGYAPACNQGLREARGEYVFALNSDAFLVKDALFTMVKYMDSNPEVGALGPRLLNADGSIQHGCARRSHTFLSQLVSLIPWFSLVPVVREYCGRHMPLDFYKQTNNVDVICGAALFMRKSTLEKIGYFDEGLIVNSDDQEWCRRARMADCKLVYLAEAEVIHIGYASRGFDPCHMHYWNVRSLFRLYDIMYTWPASVMLKCMMMTNITLVTLRNAVVAPFSTKRRKQAAFLWTLLADTSKLAWRRPK
ncbi:MAG: glycosyltransferase family 2 protein [Armatimonadota bacterium]